MFVSSTVQSQYIPRYLNYLAASTWSHDQTRQSAFSIKSILRLIDLFATSTYKCKYKPFQQRLLLLLASLDLEPVRLEVALSLLVLKYCFRSSTISPSTKILLLEVALLLYYHPLAWDSKPYIRGKERVYKNKQSPPA
jgi:hypothetical protein